MKGMKWAFALLFALSCCGAAVWGEALQRSPYDNINAPYYQIKSSIYRSMPRREGGIVFYMDEGVIYEEGKPEEMSDGISWKLLKGAFPSLTHETYSPEPGDPCSNRVKLCIR